MAIDGVCGDSAKCRVYRLPCHGRPHRREADGDTGAEGMDVSDETKASRKRKRAEVRAERRLRRLTRWAAEVSVEVPAEAKIRYEPRSHPKEGWLRPNHKAMVRIKIDGKIQAKGFSFKLDDEGGEDEFKQVLQEKMQEAAGWAIEIMSGRD